MIYTLTSSLIFFKREKVSINYYDSQISKTDLISFQNYSYGIYLIKIYLCTYSDF